MSRLQDKDAHKHLDLVLHTEKTHALHGLTKRIVEGVGMQRKLSCTSLLTVQYGIRKGGAILCP